MANSRASAIVRIALALLPLVWLYLDWRTFPATFDTRVAATQAAVRSLLAHHPVVLGTYRAHRIDVALENVAADSFDDTVEQPDALVISQFVSEDTADQVEIGQLARAVEAKLGSMEPRAAHGLTELLERASRRKSGDALDLGFEPGPSGVRVRPARIIVVTLDQGPSGAAPEVLSKALARAFAVASQRSVATITVPCVGYNWQDNQTIDFATYFNTFFDSIPLDPSPSVIRVSLYSGWPTFALEQAVTALNASWQRRVGEVRQWRDVAFYRGELRWTLAFLSLCLIVSLGFTAPTLKAFLIVGLGYIGLVIASDGVIKFLFPGIAAGTMASVQIATRAVLAVGFPFFSRWKVEKLFERQP
jgi:hypothetical protein